MKKVRKSEMKYVISLLLIAALCYSFSLAQFANAYSGRFYVYVQQWPGSDFSKGYGVRGYSTVNSNYVYDESGVASFFAVKQPNGDWLAIGYFQGHSPNGGFYPDPEYYVDWEVQGVYGMQEFGSAPLNTNHEYYVYSTMQFYPGGGGAWYACRDGQVILSKTGYAYAYGYPVAESESHDTRNSLNYHYWGLRYATAGLYWYDFDSIYPYNDTNYGIDLVSLTEFYSYGGGA